MDVKNISATTHATIAASAEARDLNQGRGNNPSKKQKENREPAKPSVNTQAAAPVSTESDVSSQLLDSEKVVHLLSQRSLTDVKKSTIMRWLSRALESKKPTLTDEKKLNKSA